MLYELIVQEGHTTISEFSVYHNLLFTEGDDKIKVWDINTGECLKVINNHKIINVKNNSKYFFTFDNNKGIYQWDVNTLKLVYVYLTKLHLSFYNFSSFGKHIINYSFEGIIVINTETRKKLIIDKITTIKLINESFFIGVNSYNELIVYDLANLCVVNSFNIMLLDAENILISNDNNYLIFIKNRQICVININDGTPFKEISFDCYLQQIIIDQNNHIIAYCATSIFIIELNSLKVINTYNTRNYIKNIVFNEDLSIIAITMSNDMLEIISIYDYKFERLYFSNDLDLIIKYKFSLDNKSLFILQNYDKIIILDFLTNQKSYFEICTKRPEINAVAVDRLNNFLIQVFISGKFELWELNGFRKIFTSPSSLVLNEKIYSISLSPNGNILSVGFNSRIVVYDLKKMDEIFALKTDCNNTIFLFSSDSKYLVISSGYGYTMHLLTFEGNCCNSIEIENLSHHFVVCITENNLLITISPNYFIYCFNLESISFDGFFIDASEYLKREDNTFYFIGNAINKNQFLVLLAGSNEILLCNTLLNSISNIIKLEQYNYVISVIHSFANKYFCFQDGNKNIIIMDLNGKELIRVNSDLFPSELKLISYIENRQILILVNKHNEIIICDLSYKLFFPLYIRYSNGDFLNIMNFSNSSINNENNFILVKDIHTGNITKYDKNIHQNTSLKVSIRV